MLHGLNFQLGAVLLSLGLFFYVEDSLRTKLSSMFNASVGSSRSDGFRHKEWELPVAMFNLACGGLAVANLAYLGVMFDQDNTMVSKTFVAKIKVAFRRFIIHCFKEEGYSWRHTLGKWQQLDYTCHLVMGFLFVLEKLI